MIRLDNIEGDWKELLTEIERMIGRKPADVNEALFLVGIQELGQGFRDFTKEEKQDLMHIATCKVLSYSGYYALEGLDEDGWPHWINKKPLPSLKVKEQERFIKSHIIVYFQNEFQ